jgi:hypothetical protein
MADEREYLERLTAVLRENGFDWVVMQAQTTIAEGKSVTKEVRAPDFPPAYDDNTLVRQTPRRRRAELIATEPFTPAEQLEILLHAVEAAIVDRVALEEAVLQSVGENINIEFLPDEGDVAPRAAPGSHRLDRGRLSEAQGVRDNLSKALKRLRDLTDASA